MFPLHNMEGEGNRLRSLLSVLYSSLKNEILCGCLCRSTAAGEYARPAAQKACASYAQELAPSFCAFPSKLCHNFWRRVGGTPNFSARILLVYAFLATFMGTKGLSNAP